MFKLAPQQFAMIFEALRQAGSNAGSEKRQSTRMDVQAKVEMATIVNGKVSRTYTGLTRDVSAAGIGLFQHMPAEPGTRMLVCFPTSRGEIVIECVSRFCRAVAEGMFGVGAQFEGLAAQELVDQMNDDRCDTLSRLRESILS